MKALIFDVDGTLAETEELHRAAFNAAFAGAGLSWVWDRATYGRLLTTTGGKERIRRYAEETRTVGIDAPTLHAAKTRAFVELMASGRITLRPGIGALLTEARARGLALAVATTTSPENVDALTQNALGFKACQIFDVIAAGDMVAAKKPAPDVYLLALRQLGLSARDAIAFEDSANGVRAARGAGLRVVLSRGIYTAHEADVGATLDLPSFADLGGLAGLRTLLLALPPKNTAGSTARL